MHPCDLCGQPATIHQTAVINGKKLERHICQSCGTKLGIVVEQAPPVSNLLHEMLGATDPEGLSTADRVKYCPSCRTTFGKFRSTGLFGCPQCYVTFAQQLMPLLERYHEGGINHVGKVPRRASSGSSPQSGPVPRDNRPAGAGKHAPGPDQPGEPATPVRLSPHEILQRVTILRKKLDAALETEDYRAAAVIRDELISLGDPELPRASGRQGGQVGQDSES